ncbi:MAG: FAD-dependent oxidoreductase [Chromatiales bacterium]|jgi:pyruvate/2-oxoglutarate dehydrogenase complex dihydrolipoamide dehydrogenase (E3) component/uncharacterized membrane protein YdjX (TVP38/TMEM64 family)
MRTSKLIALVLVVLAVVAYFGLGIDEQISFERLKDRQVQAEAWAERNPLIAPLAFIGVYVAVTGLSVPGAVPLTLLGAALFGLAWGTVLVSLGSTLGATLAFLIARHLLRDWVQSRYGKRLAAVNRGVERDGAFYLFGLRLVPVFPFFVINLVMGLTPIPTWTYLWVSWLGMLPGTLVYVNAGTQLAGLESPAGILSPQLVASFALLGVFPLLARWGLRLLRRRRAYAPFARPRRFDYNLAVVGAGSAGLVAAYIGAAARARVALVEAGEMGGDCLNTGCVPSKALIRTCRFLGDAQRAAELGVARADVAVDFPAVMERVRRVVATVAPHDSVERYTRLGVDCIRGRAELVSPWELRVGDRTLSARSIILATGARPLVPPIPGLDGLDCLTSENLWALDGLPGHLLVLGGGPIGCEMALCFRRLGAEVTIVEQAPQLLPRDDEDVAEAVAARFRAEGVDLRLGTRAERFDASGRGGVVHWTAAEGSGELAFDRVLVAVGRRPEVEGLGLERLGIELTDRGTVATDPFLRTRFPNVYACGDLVGPYQFTHAASHQAWHAAVNALLGGIWRFRVSHASLPQVVYTEPEVARVGVNEREAREQEIEFELTRFDLAELDRAITDEAREGFVKVLTRPGKDRILGACVVGGPASEMINELATGMRHGLGLNKLMATIHAYPTFSEANKMAAGVWKRGHVDPRLLGLAGWVNRRRRGG